MHPQQAHRGQANRDASAEAQVVGAFGRMSTVELCNLWEVAWHERTEPAELEQLTCVATIRRLLLDELESRDRNAFREWLRWGDPSRTEKMKVD